jgi:DNA-binding NtrC family response regulator
MVQEKTFRQDLFFRLRVVELRVPPLRERTEDIPLLALFFLKRLAKELDRPVQDIAPEAMRCLERYPWPGNIRELRNAIERGILFSSKTILEREALPEEIRYAGDNPPALNVPLTTIPPNFSLPAHLERMEEAIINQALIQCHGIQAQAAACLGISRSNLQYKLNKLHTK